MCLSIAIERPDDVLNRGVYKDHEWIVVNNGNAYRCGYIKLMPGHPWYGMGDDNFAYMDIPVDVHGGITFGQYDVQCEADGPDDGFWIGFDCVHCDDLPDPALAGYGNYMNQFHDRNAEIRSQEYVEAECFSMIDQAIKAKEQKPDES